MTTPSDRAANRGIYAVDEAFGAMAEAVGTAMWALPGLTPRECAFLCIATDICNQTLGLPFQMHVDVALANGASRRQVKEVLLHVAPDAGYPKCLQALLQLHGAYAAFDDQGRYPETGEASLADPVDRFILDPKLVAALRAMDEQYGDFVAAQATIVWNRPGLSGRERAYLSLAVDVCEGTLDGPFRMHLDLALASGATREQVRDVLRFLAEFGAPKVWRALAAFDEYTATRVA